jgi:hypothetical protein
MIDPDIRERMEDRAKATQPNDGPDNIQYLIDFNPRAGTVKVGHSWIVGVRSLPPALTVDAVMQAPPIIAAARALLRAEPGELQVLLDGNSVVFTRITTNRNVI